MKTATPPLPDRYQVLARIGQGGMATVWRARDKASSSEVAIKVLLPHLRENALVVERFKREIAAVRRIDHPGVVQVFDLLETDEVLALVMEYHAGLDLKRVVRRRGALPAEEVVAIGAQLLDALSAAHERGVIHRDVKPHNVLLGDDRSAKLTDFGLARVDDLVRVTSHTIAFGSPEYVAPELLGSDFVDPRADLYSLGVTLFEAATATLPFRADSPLALVKMHESSERPDLSDSGLPAALTRTIARALAKDPDDRFPTADAMKRSLAGEDRAVMPRIAHACPKCGAPMVARIGRCVECNHRPVRIEGRTRGGRRTFIERRGISLRNQDTLTFEQKARLMRTLREMGAIDNLSERALDRRLKQLPAVIAANLSDEDSAKLENALTAAGFDVKSGAKGIVGFLGASWRLRTSLLQFAMLYLMFLGPMFVFFLSLLFGDRFEELLGLGYVLGFFGMGTLLMGMGLARTPPLVSFGGRIGLEKGSDPISVRAAELFDRVRSARLRNLLRRVLNRGFALDDARATPLLEAALEEGEALAALESSMEAIDPHAITDRVQTIDERIDASRDTYETNELIDEKHRLLADLTTLDEKRERAAHHYAKLLQIASELSD